jgi:hypothetical protein
MHTRFGGNFPVPLQVAAIHIHDDQISWGHHAFVHAGWCGENAIRVEPDGEITFAGYDETSLVHPSPYAADFFAELWFSASGGFS